MKVEVTMLQGQQLKASFGTHEIISDQNLIAGGLEEYPEPYDYFLGSMALCATFYIRKFCQQRGIDTDGITIVQDNENIDEVNKYQQRFNITVELPENFPKKYRKAVLQAANTCTVKKVIQSLPEFSIALA